MTDYSKMYTTLFQAMTQAITILQEANPPLAIVDENSNNENMTLFQTMTRAITVLQEAQLDTEEIYISPQDPLLTIVKEPSDNENEV